jgi:hypothetical protein
MTRRLTISLPDDVAARLDAEANASAFIADAVRQRIRAEHVNAVLTGDAVPVTAEGRTRMRDQLAVARAERARPEATAARRARREARRSGGPTT